MNKILSYLPISTPVLRQHTATLLLALPATVFLLVWFLAPLSQLLLLSFSSGEGTFASYKELLSSSVFIRVFLNTLMLSAGVTVLCLVFAYPTAYLLTRLKGFWFSVGLYCVLVPFWISVLVRTFSWMLLLERNGPVNRLLIATGLINAPLGLLFSNFSVYLGMVHVLLPYAIFPMYASMLQVDARLLQASEGLGASGRVTFFRVYLPLTMPGVLAGGALVLLLALGFYITPMLLGAQKNLTVAVLIDNFVNERLVWPLAAAASFVLLLMVLSLLALASKFLSLGAMVARR
jgi:putative spermidine/putrescine transport system permease protein